MNMNMNINERMVRSPTLSKQLEDSAKVNKPGEYFSL